LSAKVKKTKTKEIKTSNDGSTNNHKDGPYMSEKVAYTDTLSSALKK